MYLLRFEFTRVGMKSSHYFLGSNHDDDDDDDDDDDVPLISTPLG